jgi:hypothetical protein
MVNIIQQGHVYWMHGSVNKKDKSVYIEFDFLIP